MKITALKWGSLLRQTEFYNVSWKPIVGLQSNTSVSCSSYSQHRSHSATPRWAHWWDSSVGKSYRYLQEVQRLGPCGFSGLWNKFLKIDSPLKARKHFYFYQPSHASDYLCHKNTLKGSLGLKNHTSTIQYKRPARPSTAAKGPLHSTEQLLH